MNSPRAQIVIDADVAPLRKVLRDGLQTVQHFASSSEGQLKNIGSGADMLRSKFGLLMGALTGGAFGVFIARTLDLMDNLDETSQKVGITTEALSELSYAAKFASLDTDDLSKTLAKLSSTLQDAKEGQKEAVTIMGRLKLDVNNIKDADQLLMELADRFSRMPDGVQKTALAIDVFGEKLGPRLIPLLNQGREGLAALRQEAHDLGVVVSNETGAAAAQFNDQLDRLKTASEGVGIAIASKLLPGLASLMDLWVQNIKGAGLFMGTMSTIGQRLKMAMGIDDLSAQQQALSGASNRMRALVNEMERLQALVADNPKAFLGATVGPDGHGPMLASQRMKQLRDEYDRTARSASVLREQLLDMADAASGKKNAGGGRGFVNPSAGDTSPFVPGAKDAIPTKTPKAKADQSQMELLEAMLAKQKQMLVEGGFIREFEAQRELAFWQGKLERATLSGADRLKIERKVAQLSYEVKSKGLEQERQLDELRRKSFDDVSLSRVEVGRAAAKALLDNDQITKSQFLQLELDYETQRYAIQVQALQDRLALLAQDPNTNPVEAARIKAELLRLEQEYQLARLNTMGDLTKEGGGGGLGSVMGDVGSSFSASMNGLLTQTQTWAQATMGLFKGVRDSFIQNLITEPVGKYIASQAKMLALKMGFMAQEQGLQAAGSASTVAIKAAETGAVVSANAIQAGTGAAASQAPIPIVGPALALAAMAAIFAAVSGFGGGGSRKSAAKGYDIPSGVNPITQLHEEEMVLPAKYANAVRAMTANGAGEGGAPGGRGGLTMPVHVTAMDTRSVVQSLRQGGALNTALRGMHRDFVRI